MRGLPLQQGFHRHLDITQCCVAPLMCGGSAYPWEHRKKHIQADRHSNIGIDLEALQKEVLSMSQQNQKFDKQFQDWYTFSDLVCQIKLWNYVKAHY